MTRLFAAAATLLLASAAGSTCDIYAAASTPCVAAFSLVRALYASFAGPLYEVTRVADNATLRITVRSPGGVVDASPQVAFCGNGSAPPALPALGSIVKLRPRGFNSLSFRHCDAQGFVTPDDGDDHDFTLVAALDGSVGGVSFRSLNFPDYYISPVGVPEPSRLGIVQAPSAADASWTVTPSEGGGFTLTLPSHGGQAMAVASYLTGNCARNYAAPSASVSLAGAATSWIIESQATPACTISRIFDQSQRANDLTPAPPGGAARHPDSPVDAMAFPITVSGEIAFGARFEGRMGYRIDDTNGVAKGNDPETIYSVVAGSVFNSGCCMDFGNAESNNLDDGEGTMEAVYFGSWNATRSGSETWGIKAGDGAAGKLNTQWVGPRPPGYAPMRKQGAIILGIGGDNSDSATGVWIEGVMTSGVADDAADDAVQADLVAAALRMAH